jgi:Domain of unknown function (DUF6456)
MQRQLVERHFDVEHGMPAPARAGARVAPPGGRGLRTGRSVTVNLAESPLSWLRARGMVDARQYEAGERLRADYERAMMGPSVTMRWDASAFGLGSKTRRAAPDPGDRTLGQVDAKRRFDAAIAGAGKGLGDVLWRVICANEALPVAEKAMGWPVRSGRVVLTLALDRLADGYGLR